MGRRFDQKLTAAVALLLAGSSVSLSAQSDPGQVAFSLEREGKTVEAEAAWKAIAEQHPSNPEPLAHLGLLAARQEHYAEAIADYKKAMALNPSMPGLRLNLGLAYFKAGDFEHTIQDLSPLLKAQPDDERLTVLVGMSHYGLGQFRAASPLLKKASDEDAQNLNLLLALAHSCLFSSQYPCVLDAYHRIIALNAESAEADMLVGEALDEMKDHLGAIREFRAAAAANPKEPNVHFGLGYLLWTRAEYPEAAKEFQTELDNDPHHQQAMLYLADANIQMNKVADAGPLLEAVIQANAKVSMAHRDLGIAYAEQGRKEDALREFKTAIQLAPDDVNVHWRLARLYRSMGQAALAKAEFDKAGSLNKAADDKLLKVMSTIPANKQTTPASPANK